MKRTVKFDCNESTSAAKSVAQHLYYVVQDSDKLIFSEFDEAAFKAAVALEGLTRTDYSYAGNDLIPPARTGVRFRAFGRPKTSLDFTLNLPESQHRAINLNVLDDTAAIPSNEYGEFSLAINPPLTYLILILESAMRHESDAQKREFESIVANLESARIQIRNQSFSRGAFACGNLVLNGLGRSYEISLNLFDARLNINYSIFD